MGLRTSPDPDRRSAGSDNRPRTALLLAAHGERGVGDPNRALIDHAADLASRVDCLRVDCGVLNGEPALESALDAAVRHGADEVLIYPFFMADGYFVSQVLSARLAAAARGLAWSILPPLGLDSRLPRLMMRSALDAAKDAGFDPDTSQLLVVGHGSKLERASAQATRQVAGELAAMEQFASVASAFIEEPPFVADALAEAQAPVVVAGFFAGDGMHSSRDVPEAIEGAGAPAVYTGPIGIRPAVRDLVVAAVARHRAETGAAAAEESR